MKTEQQIQRELERFKDALIRDDSIEAVKYHQGYIRALEYVLSENRSDAFA